MKRWLGRVAGILLSAACFIAVTSCSTLHEANHNIGQTEKRVDKANDILTKSAPAAVASNGFYVNEKPVNWQNQPAWLKQRITVNTQGMPFDLLVARILRNTNTNISYDSNTSRDVPITFSYSGTIKGALDALAAQANYAYNIDSSGLEWSSMVTQTFNISFMPGASNYFVGQNPADNAQSSAAQGSGDVVSVSGNLGNSQFSNLQGRLSVWDDLRSALNQFKSADGKVWISESTTTVTVQDHPSNIKSIARYIDKLNKIMTEQVSIRVTVLELTLSKDYNYGINWAVVQNALGTQFSLQGDLANAANISGAVSQASGSNGILAFQIGTASSNAVIQALSQQGDLSVVTQPTVVTMNNQVAEIRITQDTGYLQSITTTVVANSGGGAQTSLTPGLVTDGFSLYLLPKIQGGEIYLQISSTLSNLVSLVSVNNKGTTTPSEDQQNEQNFQAIQVPTLSEKHFNQRTVLHSGSTLVITGFQSLRDETKTVAPYGATALGGKGARRNNIQTVVLITPSIVRGTT